jgi:hypothetical protein
MDSLIRKISVGSDYKTAMHYIVSQSVLGGSHFIHAIINDSATDRIKIFISNEKSEIVLWKEFSYSVPISIEFNIDY